MRRSPPLLTPVMGTPGPPPGVVETGNSLEGVVGVFAPLVPFGETLRVEGACTAIESAADEALVTREVVLPVRRTETGKRGRLLLVVVPDDAGGMVDASDDEYLAASWFSEGPRGFEGFDMAFGVQRSRWLYKGKRVR